MTTPADQRQRRELRSPETSQLRDVLAAQADRRSEQFGKGPIHPGPAKDWLYLHGEWRIGYVWLLEDGGRVKNRGFRVTVGGRVRCTVEAWGDDGRVTMEYHHGLPNAEQVTKVVSLAFGARKA